MLCLPVRLRRKRNNYEASLWYVISFCKSENRNMIYGNMSYTFFMFLLFLWQVISSMRNAFLLGLKNNLRAVFVRFVCDMFYTFFQVKSLRVDNAMLHFQASIIKATTSPSQENSSSRCSHSALNTSASSSHSHSHSGAGLAPAME